MQLRVGLCSWRCGRRSCASMSGLVWWVTVTGTEEDPVFAADDTTSTGGDAEGGALSRVPLAGGAAEVWRR